MALLEMITMLSDGATMLCEGLRPVMRLVGFVVLGIKVGVPIILIVVGMMDLAKAVTEKNEDKVKEAQKNLVSKAVAAVMVFLVVTIVGFLMTLVGDENYQECMKCVNHPTQCPTSS